MYDWLDNRQSARLVLSSVGPTDGPVNKKEAEFAQPLFYCKERKSIPKDLLSAYALDGAELL
jgi:hypothetical protein